MKHKCISRFRCGCGCETRQFLKKKGEGVTIKKLLKIFLFIYIFTIKIFLKNTLSCLDSQNKERRRQETHTHTNKKNKTKQKKQQIFRIKLRNDRFRIFGPHLKLISAILALFWPISTITVVGRYDLIWPIQLDFGRIVPVWRELARIEAELTQIYKKRKKKKEKEKVRRGTDARAAMSDATPCVGL